MPPRVTATANLPCDLRFATPEAYEQLLAGTAGGREDGGAPHSAEEAEEPPVHLFPEGGVTNGRWGMMQFSRGEGCKRWGGGRRVSGLRQTAGTVTRHTQAHQTGFALLLLFPPDSPPNAPLSSSPPFRLYSFAAARGLGGARSPQGEHPPGVSEGGIGRGHPCTCDQPVGTLPFHQTLLLACPLPPPLRCP